MNTYKKKILVAPLNWGLGHATRCIPIINGLIDNGFEPIIASDGIALELLKIEFPQLKTIELPSYSIEYSKKGSDFKWKMIVQLPKIISAVRKEQKMTTELIKTHNLDGIISDNRLGVYSKNIPSVFVTHQLNVLTGNTSWLTTKLHKKHIRKFDECWVPDVENSINLTGKLGHTEDEISNVKYIGPLSRLSKKSIPIVYDLMVILSGPEPQRSLLETKIISELEHYPKKVVFVKGIIEKEQIKEQIGNITYYNFMKSKEIETAFNESNLILCRSGYTTVMDLAKLNKNAFFIPTPGQFEQEYLAEKFQKEKIAPFCKQEDFQISMLNEMESYKGFSNFTEETNWEELFSFSKVKENSEPTPNSLSM